MNDNELLKMYFEKCESESFAQDKIKELSINMLPYAKELWGRGDGEGGAVIKIIIDTFLENNLPPRLSAYNIAVDLRSNYRMSKLRRQVFERDGYRCKKCGDWHNLELDHIYPESKGGETTIENLQTLCSSCNAKKGAKIL